MRTRMHRALRALLCTALALPSCARGGAKEEAQAGAAFRAAWSRRQAGDEMGYREALKEIGSRFPATRAGRRARELGPPGAPGGMMMLAAVGAAAAIAIPFVMKYKARAEAPRGL